MGVLYSAVFFYFLGGGCCFSMGVLCNDELSSSRVSRSRVSLTEEEWVLMSEINDPSDVDLIRREFNEFFIIFQEVEGVTYRLQEVVWDGHRLYMTFHFSIPSSQVEKVHNLMNKENKRDDESSS